jgi:CubicO group peptidase (beta-lactamase class C family)
VESFAEARRVVAAAIAGRVFPGAVVEVGTPDTVVWRASFGHLDASPASLPVTEGTIYDLASLTKVVATATLVTRLVESGRLGLHDRVARWLDTWSGADRERVTVRDLLAHTSGLPAWLPLFEACEGRAAYEDAISRTPLAYRPGSAAVYSDLGFVLLGFIVHEAGGAPLDVQFSRLRDSLELGEMGFRAPASGLRTARTDLHDRNASALGDVAGHSGLFGAIGPLGRFAKLMLQARAGDAEACRLLGPRDLVLAFTTRTDVPGSSRALAWDTMLPTSSCGTRMSASAFGHTGYTGTSLWIDPERASYVVFLANRMPPAPGREEMQQVRRTLHDAIMDSLR